jgi:hypothetical protein
MTTLLTLVLWCLLMLLCWPLAIATVVLFPIIWLVSLPFRRLFNVAEAFLSLIKALLFLPARLLGHKS